MKRGKQTCKILKEIRKQIAEENDIQLVIEECTYQGDCLGTCPKCEAEVRYLERELEKRQRLGKAAVFAGMSLGTLFAATSCDHSILQPLEGEPAVPDTTEQTNDTLPNDTITDDVFMLEGDVVKVLPDTLKEEEEKKAGCKSDVLSAIAGEVVEIDTTEIIEGELPDFEREYIAPEVGEVSPDDMIDEVYTIVEQMPEFPGGEAELLGFISRNIHYPEEAKKDGIQGRVFIGFVIEEDGSVSNVRNLRGVDSELDAEAMRVVESMPKWKPGMQRGQAVRVSYILPIVFKLQ